ncbi:hypothetical protein GCM10010404_89440 [Nonomuraea africana]|uniref:Lipoprotein n=1 Tax=Nonomuraea africana TaxID=46171 RepID=A0ABR9KAN6_9ACTN|nr:hypothetical protein [Nonomuraea africana]MBE1559069.1 hypothetical protein [Nonomuraea africana]
MRAFVTAALALAVLTGCATDAPEPAAPSATGAGQEAKWKMERFKADCMKQKGFKYTPFVMSGPKETEAQKKMATGDYAAAKEVRTKYGYRIFAQFVYPDDSASGALVIEEYGQNPNPGARLNETQSNAYKTAENACMAKAFKAVLNKDVKNRRDVFKMHFDLKKQLTTRRLDGDAELVRLAATFGDCLKGKGYAITSLKPSDLAGRGEKAMVAQVDKIGKEQGKFWPDITAAQARPYLAKEIKDALDDLECGKEFYARYSPMSTAVDQEVEAQLPL